MRLQALQPPTWPVHLCAVLGLFVHRSAAGMNFTGKTLTDVFWQLEYVNTPPNGNPLLGGQNFTTCCLKAINEAIEIGPNGGLQFVSQFENWIVFDEGDEQPLDLLVNYSLRGQFPCTAVYNGDARGAPVVQVNYTWLADTCPGWEISSKDNLNAWLQPLSGFLVPAVIFCLSVPRRRKLEVPRFLFSPDQGGIKSYLLAPLGATLALVMVSLDTLVWLCICFGFAGPMILSGLYEAMLDNSVLEYLRLKVDESRLTLDMRCRCLMVILIGNLDLVWNTEDPDGNGGYVDGGTHGGSYISDAADDGDAEDEHLHYTGRGSAVGSFDDRPPRGNSAEIPLMPLRGSGAYQSIPSGEQSSPSPAGAPLYGRYDQPGVPVPNAPYAPYSSSYPYPPYASGPSGTNGSPSPSRASLSPRGPAPALPASSNAAAVAIAPMPSAVQQFNPIESAASHGSALPTGQGIWQPPNNSGSQSRLDANGADQNTAIGAVQVVVPPPPPPISRTAENEDVLLADESHGGSIIPGLFISPASAGPDPRPVPDFSGQQQYQHQQPQHQSYMGAVPGFPPDHADPNQPVAYGVPSGAASPGAPSTPVQHLSAPAHGTVGTPFASSGFVAAGVVAAGVGVGVSHDANRRLLVNHQNGGPLASPWQHMEEFLYSLRIYNDDFPTRQHSPRQYAKHSDCPDGINCHNDLHNEPPIPRTPETERLIHQVKTRLKTMLHCQYSFGSVIGAPVVFFLGGFIFALLQSLDALGDEDIAEGLAFGQWYMTIPHIAIISGLLLAGNNPNILEGVLAVERKYRQDNITIFGLTYGLAYPSCYKVASLWDRGYNKKQWLNTLIATYLVRSNAVYSGNEDYDKDIVDLKKKTTLSLSDWSFLLALTLMLLGLPYILAFLTAYFTPEIGLSCRSLTFTIYILVQISQIILWLWAYAGPLSVFNVDKPGFFSIGGWLDKRGFYEPYSVRWLVDRGQVVPRNPFKLLRLVWNDPGRLVNWRFIWNSVYYTSQWLLGFIGITAAIGGTAMQLMGVYSADICYVTTAYWFAPLEERPAPIISVNSALMIRESELMWKPCAITAIVFMSVVSFVGWWYQRRMRDLFQDQVRRIDQNERRDTRASRPDRGRVRPRVTSGAPLTIRTLTPSIPSAMPASVPRDMAGASAVTTGYGGYGRSQSVRRAVLRSAASASAQVVRSTSTSSTPLVRSVAAKAVRMPVNNLALAARYFSQTARVAEEAEQPTSDSVPAAASVGETNVEAQDPTPYGIFIRNVVFDASDANLREAFEHYGPINSTFIARDPRGMSKGFGFVYFENAEAQAKALEEANGSFWHGRRLSVQPRQRRQLHQADPNRPPRADDRPLREPSNCLYIGNLPYETTDADLTVTFRDVDGLQAVRVAVDRATGWPRGFAHADFDSIESAKAAYEYLKDKQVGSRTLRIDYASPTKYFSKRNSSESQEEAVSEATN